MAHFAQKCRSKSSDRKKPRHVNAYALTKLANTANVDEDLPFVFSVEGRSIMSSIAVVESGFTTLLLGGVPLDSVLLNSGAVCNVLSFETQDHLRSQRVKCIHQMRSARQSFAYNSLATREVFGCHVHSVHIALLWMTLSMSVPIHSRLPNNTLTSFWLPSTTLESPWLTTKLLA